MPQTTLTRKRGKLYAYSFTTGTQPVTPPVRKTERDIWAEILRLHQSGKTDDAELLLEKYCS